MTADEQARQIVGHAYRRAMTWFAIAALAIIALAMLGTNANAQRVNIVRAPLLTGFAAVTTCDEENNITIVVDGHVSDTAYVLAHERIHTNQMKRFDGGCTAFLNRFRADPLFRLAMESEAYCAGYNIQVANGMPKEGIWLLVAYMQKNFAPALSTDEVRKYVPCGRDVTFAARDGTATIQP